MIEETLRSTFPFGKYKGTKLVELPSTYITFALETFDLREDIMNALRVVLMYRTDIINFIGKEIVNIEGSHTGLPSDLLRIFGNYYLDEIESALESIAEVKEVDNA